MSALVFTHRLFAPGCRYPGGNMLLTLCLRKLNINADKVALVVV